MLLDVAQKLLLFSWLRQVGPCDDVKLVTTRKPCPQGHLRNAMLASVNFKKDNLCVGVSKPCINLVEVHEGRIRRLLLESLTIFLDLR